jgi:hypothetical protein
VSNQTRPWSLLEHSVPFVYVLLTAAFVLQWRVEQRLFSHQSLNYLLSGLSGTVAHWLMACMVTSMLGLCWVVWQFGPCETSHYPGVESTWVYGDAVVMAGACGWQGTATAECLMSSLWSSFWSQSSLLQWVWMYRVDFWGSQRTCQANFLNTFRKTGEKCIFRPRLQTFFLDLANLEKILRGRK